MLAQRARRRSPRRRGDHGARHSVDGRPVCVMANDSTVKARWPGARGTRSRRSSASPRSALDGRAPVFWLVDSAGARITDQVELFPGAAGGTHLLQPGPAVGSGPADLLPVRTLGGRRCIHPTFTDVVFMVDGNASMYLGSPRMAQVVIGETSSLEETGGARVHAEISGCGDNLVADDEDAIAWARWYFHTSPRTGATIRLGGCGRTPIHAVCSASLVPANAAPGLRHAHRDRRPRRRRLLPRGEAAVRRAGS